MELPTPPLKSNVGHILLNTLFHPWKVNRLKLEQERRNPERYESKLMKEEDLSNEKKESKDITKEEIDDKKEEDKTEGINEEKESKEKEDDEEKETKNEEQLENKEKEEKTSESESSDNNEEKKTDIDLEEELELLFDIPRDVPIIISNTATGCSIYRSTVGGAKGEEKLPTWVEDCVLRVLFLFH